MRNLAIFDVDGTLTATNEVDHECFVSAMRSSFALGDGDLDWAGAPHVTDASIMRWICETHAGHAPPTHQRDSFIGEFVGLLRKALTASPERFAPVPGATGLVPILESAGWDVALATGGWSASAQLKLGEVEPALLRVAFASASDAESREEILRLALSRAESRSGSSYSRVVSLGDGLWDVRTARALDMPFIGIATGRRAEELRGAGASIVLPDFLERSALLDALATACVPVLLPVAKGTLAEASPSHEKGGRHADR
jgi:phosphoglycolate phosphatase-like HAD superfamily hydrolase